MRPNLERYTFELTRDLKKRFYAVTDRLHTTAGVFAREMLAEKIEYYETKFRVEDERKKIDTLKNKKSKLKRLRKLGDPTNISPKHIVESSQVEDDENDSAEIDELAQLYEHHAKLVAQSVEDPAARRARVAEALAAVKRFAPLTHPSDAKIIETLQKIVKLYIKPPQAAPATEEKKKRDEDAVQAEIDPDRIQSFGDVGDE